MSLQLAAQHLATKGRGPDTMLVHMAPGEVKSLQTLARAHGGTLTTNPDTGLPEAGFLSAILPLVAGAALGPAGLGLSAMQAGLAAGAVGTLATGSLRKGLMAGLGAYGGAGLMGSVTGAGTEALQAANTTPGAMSPIVAPQAPAFLTQPAMPAVEGFVPTSANMGPMGEMLDKMPIAPGTSGVMGSGTSSFGAPKFDTPFIATNPAAASVTPNLAPVVDRSTYPMMDTMKAGAKSIFEDPSKLMTKDNLRYGMAAAAPLMMQEPKRETYQGGGPNPYQYSYDPGAQSYGPSSSSAEQKYFDPRYKRMADGGSTSDTNPYSYVYDPVTRSYKSAAQSAPVASRTSQANNVYYSGEPGPATAGGPDDGNIGWSQLTPMEQAVYYAQNPTMAAITQLGQGLFGMTSLGQLQNAFVPDFVAQQQSIPNAGPGGYLSSLDLAMAGPSTPAGPTSGGGMSVQDGMMSGLDAAIAAANSGVDVGGPISSGDVTGVDVGGIGDAVAGGVAGADVGGIGDAVGDGGGGDGGGDGGDGGDYARGGLSALRGVFAKGGYNLGDYSDGGRLLKGPGDGVSDDIPATIANKRPARLADGEFVIPARIVSELGNGSTEAGARKLYAMMNRVQKNRAKTVGKGKIAVNSRSEKLLPA